MLRKLGSNWDRTECDLDRDHKLLFLACCFVSKLSYFFTVLFPTMKSEKWGVRYLMESNHAPNEIG